MTAFRYDCGDRLAHRILVSYVEGCGRYLPAVERDLVRHGIELVLLAPRQDDMRPQARQLMRDTTADAAARTGDDVGLARETILAQHAAIAHRGLLPLAVQGTLNHVDVNVNRLLSGPTCKLRPRGAPPPKEIIHEP